MTEEDFDPTGLLALLDGEESLASPPAMGDPELATQRRLEVETLGLLAFGLEPVAPRPAARARLLAEVASIGAPAELAPVVSLAAVRGERTGAAAGLARGWGLAAAVVLGVVGLGGAAWSFYERSRFAEELAQMRREQEVLIATLQERDQQLAAEREVRQGELGRRNQALQLVSTRGVEVCPLRPVGAAATLQPEAFAVLYMAPAQKSWYVKASQLDPAPAGRAYRVWFETDNGPVFAGDLRPAPDFDLQFEAAGFRSLAMKGVKITLEPAGSGLEPTGPSVLFGADKMTVL
ncbi:MAG: anti-sigma factor [Thermoanaerobaculia bacterium]|nr:anti-sigma factor [Thermoanaerobaculia bacterium]